MTRVILLRWWLVACCVVLSSCTLGDRMKNIFADANDTQADIARQHELFGQAITSTDARRAAQNVDQPWIVGRAVPLARSVSLPSALQANVNTTMFFAGGAIGLRKAAQRITAVTGIPVYVSPEAMLPLARFLPKLAGAAVATGAATGSADATVTLSGGPQPLVDVLDRICARLGVHWRYQSHRITFYRTQTRVFNVRSLTLNSSAEASLGLQGDSKSEGFVSSSHTRLTGGVQDPMKAIRARLEPFLSQAGVLVAEPGASSLVVVTDTPEVLGRIAAYLETENKALTRRVRLVFEEITLLTEDSAEAGIDWSVVFSSAQVAAALSIAGAPISEAGMLGASVQSGPFEGSEAIIKALSKVGRVVRRSSVPVLTLNRRPVTHAVRTTFSYIDQIQTTALASGTGAAIPSVSISQRDETVGSLLTLVPDAQDNGQILLSVAYDNTVAQPLKTVTFGDKENPLQVQQITIDGNGTVQQVLLQPGQPMVVSGFDRAQKQAQGRRLNPEFPAVLGGSDQASSQRLMTVVIISAQVEEGV